MENIRREKEIRFISCDELIAVAFSFNYKRSVILRATREEEKKYQKSELVSSLSTHARFFIFSRASKNYGTPICTVGFFFLTCLDERLLDLYKSQGSYIFNFCGYFLP